MKPSAMLQKRFPEISLRNVRNENNSLLCQNKQQQQQQKNHTKKTTHKKKKNTQKSVGMLLRGKCVEGMATDGKVN